MSVDPHDPSDATLVDAATIVARAADASRHGDARLQHAINDYLLDTRDRLDDRTRAALTTLVQHSVSHIARALTPSGNDETLKRLIDATVIDARVIDARLLDDRAAMRAWIGAAGAALLSASLVATRPPGTLPALLGRLIECDDAAVAGAASRYFAAPEAATSALPLDGYRRLVWRIAAVLREGGADTIALARAAARAIDDYRADTGAQDLAIAIDAQPAELPDLLVEALGDGHVALAAAILAHTAAIDVNEVLDLVLAVDGERLWVLLRSLSFDRAAIARVALLLADADPRRDIETFADQLDAIAAISPDDARAALLPLTLERDFRDAIREIGRAG